ncbi:MAG: hypothetical protein AAF502_19865 [Bacteroidota bacterium]
MSDIKTIDINRTLPNSQDWSFLREKGLGHLEELTSKIWTDFNVHDPGITQLEVLCYALTDLGYRLEFPMEDILADDPNAPVQPNKAFHTAREILTTKPLTITDYRKLLIDVKGVKNAWLSYCYQTSDNRILPVRAETRIFAACKAQKLAHESEKPALEALKDILTEVKIRGLWRVMLEFDEDLQFLDLNTGLLQYRIFSGPLEGITLQIDLPRWEEANQKLLDANKVNKVVMTDIHGDGTNWTADWEIRLPGGKKVFWNNTPIYIVSNRKDRKLEGTTFRNRLKNGLQNQDGVPIVEKYINKVKTTLEIVEEVTSTLQANRNLCEDFRSIRSIDLEDIAFCADIDLQPTADLEEVLAEIYRLIDNYLSPPVKFHTLSELVKDGVATETIFDGPTLKYGFLLKEEVEATALRKMVYTSDIINLLQDIEGVIAIKNVMLTKYDSSGNKVEQYSGERWEIPITLNHKPRLNRERSKILFFKNRLPLSANLEEAESKLKLKQALDNHLKLKDPTIDFPIPKGKYRNLDKHYTIQQDFPQVYGVGKFGVSRKATAQRKAQSKQLKAYLNFFDQLLANYFKQLSVVKELYSWNDSVDHTYASNYLNNIKSEGDAGVVTLVHDNVLYQDAAILEAALPSMVEAEEVFLERRNRFLDHLLARFAEQFNEYALLMYSIKGKKITDNQVSQELISDKINFLENYPELSSERAKAFNYRDGNTKWDSLNVAGLKKRASLLLGFNDFKRQSYCLGKDRFFVTTKEVETDPGVFNTFYNFEFKDEKGKIIFTSVTDYESEFDVRKAIAEVKSAGQRKNNYKGTTKNGKFGFDIELSGEVIARKKTFISDQNSVKKLINQLVKAFKEEDVEGFHLIEHLLMRARSESDDLLGVCIDPGCKFCGEEDPYSFRVSLVFPYWPERFQNMDYRNFVEQLLREEAPAHVFLKICWVDQEQMCAFEEAYQAWLAELDTPTDQFSTIQNTFINQLESLRSIFPMATLHDCEDNDQENDNRVFLGSTILGTYNFDQ